MAKVLTVEIAQQTVETAQSANTAQTALIVAVVSASVTLLGLLWQLALYKLSGSRVRVRLFPVVMSRNGTALARGAQGGAMSGRVGGFHEPGQLGIELALVQVTNIGRVAVSVENISLDLGRCKWWSWSRYTVAPHTVERPGHSREIECRLEPGGTVKVLFVLEAALRDHLPTAGRVRCVRGSAKPANRWRAVRSPFWLRWRFEPGRATFLGEDANTPAHRAYRELWAKTRTADGTSDAIEQWEEIRAALEKGLRDQELAALFSGLTEIPTTVAHAVAAAWDSNGTPSPGPVGATDSASVP
ncbi:hypothetical protein GS439_11315 [Rhodococcus hoagii]|nr:hypothetical protein [Prescottella equi]